MHRVMAVRIAAWLAVAGLGACGPAATAPGDPLFAGPRNTDSPISGRRSPVAEITRTRSLVFAPDGTLSGRYAGHDVSGEWNALDPDRVAVMLRAGGIAVRETMRRTGEGWQGENTACG